MPLESLQVERVSQKSTQVPSTTGRSRSRNIASLASLKRAEQVKARRPASLLARAAAVAPSPPQVEVGKLEPIGDRILVKADEESSTTTGGIIVSPVSSQGSMGLQDAVIGEVLAVGSEVDIKVKKGDKIIYSKYSTSDVNVEDSDVTFVAQKSVLATLS